MIIFFILALTFFTNTFAEYANQLLIDNNCYSQEQLCEPDILKSIIESAKVHEDKTLTKTALIDDQERIFTLNVESLNDQITKAKCDLLKCAIFDEYSRANVEKTEVILSFSQISNTTLLFLNHSEAHKNIHERCGEKNIILIILGLDDCYRKESLERSTLYNIVSFLAFVATNFYDKGKAFIKDIEKQEVTTTWTIQNNILEVSCTGSQGLVHKESFKLTELPLDAKLLASIESCGHVVLKSAHAREFLRRINILAAQALGIDAFIQILEENINIMFTCASPAEIRDFINKSFVIPFDNPMQTLALIKLVKNGIIGLDEKAENIILKETNQALSVQELKELLYPLVEEIKLPSLPEAPEESSCTEEHALSVENEEAITE